MVTGTEAGQPNIQIKHKILIYTQNATIILILECIDIFRGRIGINGGVMSKFERVQRECGAREKY